MGRKKVKCELISDESSRKTTFKKRKAGLLKKLQEITTLCGVIACGIIFSNFSTKGRSQQPNQQQEVWPSVPEATAVVEKFKDLPEKKQRKYMLNQESLLSASSSKMKEKLEAQVEKNRRLELDLLLADPVAAYHHDVLPDSGSSEDFVNHAAKLDGMREIVSNKVDQITERIEHIKSKGRRMRTRYS
ncbi:unnamed protein product [Linum tenue]|uniref:MADS-box domain-containing protein n=1 Tax=Linum tenue TaxID=586396 RepID=A0AAV0IHN1_9ROSI|nr:unnamed protein product [Linum tenue]